MKRFIILPILIGLFLLPEYGYSQVSWITDATVAHNNATRPALIVDLMASPKEVKKAWKDFVDKEYDINVSGYGFLTNKDVLSAEAIYLPGNREHKLDLYAQIIPVDGKDLAQTRMSLFGAFGYDMYIDRYEHRQEYYQMRTIFNTFLKDFLPEYYREEMEDVQDAISDLQKDREKLIERNQDIREEIVISKNEISMLKESIVELENEQNENELKIQSLDGSIEIDQEKRSKLKSQMRKRVPDSDSN